MKKLVLFVLMLYGALTGSAEAAGVEKVVRLEDLDLSKISQPLGRPQTTGPNSALTITGQTFASSIQTRAKSRLSIELDGQAIRFSALGGIGDGARTNLLNQRGIVGKVEFLVYGDEKVLQRRGLTQQRDRAVQFQVKLAGVHHLLLAVDGPDAEKSLRIVVGDQLALTPPMGWNSWNVTEGLIGETVLEEMADAMVAYGFRDVGYQYIDIDDEWVVSRDASGRPMVDPIRFPHGFKPVADYLHARGFKIGNYSSPGATTCGGFPGTLGHEAMDVSTWKDGAADLLKYDRCRNPPDRSHDLYVLMGVLLKDSGRSIVYSLCEPKAELGAEAKAQMWRTAGDIRDTWHLRPADGFIDCFDKQTISGNDQQFEYLNVSKYQRPGAWNDPYLLVVGIYGKGAAANDEAATSGNDIEYRTQMSLWAMLSAPLMATADLRVISPEAVQIITNPEVIEVDQDALGQVPLLACRQGEFQAWSEQHDYSSPIRPTPPHSAQEVWVKGLTDGTKVVALLNRSDHTATIRANWSDVGVIGKQRLAICGHAKMLANSQMSSRRLFGVMEWYSFE